MALRPRFHVTSGLGRKCVCRWNESTGNQFIKALKWMFWYEHQLHSESSDQYFTADHIAHARNGGKHSILRMVPAIATAHHATFGICTAHHATFAQVTKLCSSNGETKFNLQTFVANYVWVKGGLFLILPFYMVEIMQPSVKDQKRK